MTLPTDAIKSCIEFEGHNRRYPSHQRNATKQLQALLDAVAEKDMRIAELEKECKEYAKCITDSTFGGWYS